MAGCPYCGQDHHERYTCNAKHTAMANKPDVANTDVANTSGRNLVSKRGSVVDASNTYRYRDQTKRRAYMRDYMRRRRSP